MGGGAHHGGDPTSVAPRGRNQLLQLGGVVGVLRALRISLSNSTIRSASQSASTAAALSAADAVAVIAGLRSAPISTSGAYQACEECEISEDPDRWLRVVRIDPETSCTD